MFKKCKVVMLPTNEKANGMGIIVLNKQFNSLGLGYGNNIDNQQHLYIISDEEIKKGNWCINDNHDTLYQSDWNVNETTNWSKVIATTDISLIFNHKEFPVTVPLLPSPSQSFIDKYISEYNKGNIIIDVMVEYEDRLHYENTIYKDSNKLELKVSKDNTITIKRIKDSWSREEVKSLVIDGMRFMNSYIINHDTLHGQVAKQVANNWIEENL